jgi:hypothetical protein
MAKWATLRSITRKRPVFLSEPPAKKTNCQLPTANNHRNTNCTPPTIIAMPTANCKQSSQCQLPTANNHRNANCQLQTITVLPTANCQPPTELYPLYLYPFFPKNARTFSRWSPCTRMMPSLAAPPVPQNDFNFLPSSSRSWVVPMKASMTVTGLPPRCLVS